MLAVAVVGLLTLAWLHRALLHPGTRTLLWAGLAVGWLAIAVDQWPEAQAHLPHLPELPPLLATLEEGFEVVAEALVVTIPRQSRGHSGCEPLKAAVRGR